MPKGVYERTKKEPRVCSVEDCENKYQAKGLCRKHYHKQWYQDNKKKQLNQSKQWREDNSEYQEQYYQDNKEWHAKQMKKYHKTPAGRAVVKASSTNRRALTKDLTKEIVQRVYEDNIKKYGTLTCILCGKPVEFTDSSLEHLMPLSRGGSNNYENLGIAHNSCNKRKGTKTLGEWISKL